VDIADKIRAVIAKQLGDNSSYIYIGWIRPILSSSQGRYIITDIKNIRFSHKSGYKTNARGAVKRWSKDRLTATVTVKVAPHFTNSIQKKLIWTSGSNKYRGEIK